MNSLTPLDSPNLGTESITALIRHGLTTAAGALVAKGLADQSTASQLVGAGMFLIGFAWSWLHKWRRSHQSPVIGSQSGRSLLWLFLLSAFCSQLFLSGCASLTPGADPLVVRVEQAQSVAFTTLDTAVHLDNSNRPFWRTNAPGFHQFCEWLRAPQLVAGTTNTAPRGLVMCLNLDAVKQAYKAGTATSNTLVTVLAVVESAVTQAQPWIAATVTNGAPAAITTAPWTATP